MTIDKEMIRLYIMIIGMCVFFFILGYYFAYHNAVDHANEVIMDYEQQRSLYYMVKEPMNFTFDSLNIGGYGNG